MYSNRMDTTTTPQTTSKAMLWTGWVISAIPVLFMLGGGLFFLLFKASLVKEGMVKMVPGECGGSYSYRRDLLRRHLSDAADRSPRRNSYYRLSGRSYGHARARRRTVFLPNHLRHSGVAWVIFARCASACAGSFQEDGWLILRECRKATVTKIIPRRNRRAARESRKSFFGNDFAPARPTSARPVNCSK